MQSSGKEFKSKFKLDKSNNYLKFQTLNHAEAKFQVKMCKNDRF